MEYPCLGRHEYPNNLYCMYIFMYLPARRNRTMLCMKPCPLLCVQYYGKVTLNAQTWNTSSVYILDGKSISVVFLKIIIFLKIFSLLFSYQYCVNLYASIISPDIYEYHSIVYRIFVVVCLMASFIIGTLYKSNLMAMIIKPRIVLPFNSFPELLDTSLRIVVASGSVLYGLFRVSYLFTISYLFTVNYMFTISYLHFVQPLSLGGIRIRPTFALVHVVRGA